MFSKVKILTIYTTFFIAVNFVQSQSTTITQQTSDSLQQLNLILTNSIDEEQLLSTNAIFIEKLNQVLRTPASYTYSFDSLKIISVISPKDNSFRLLTWFILLSDGTYEYYGFVQLSPKLKANVNLFELHDSSATATRAEHVSFSASNWYGAKYYKLIETKYRKISYYTLLAWDGNTMNSNKKIIDILTFNEDHQPVFGFPLFKVSDKGKILLRVIFEYAEDAAFGLRYDKQTYPGSTKKTNMIVFDRLYPISDNLKGQAAFYVPATNICDGFNFEKGQWVMVKDIDVRNEKAKVKRIRETRIK